MKRKATSIATALLLCASLAISALAEGAHGIYTSYELEWDIDPPVSITNFIGETNDSYSWTDVYDGMDYSYDVRVVKAAAPATVTVVSKFPLGTWHGDAIGDIGSTIRRAKLPENKRSDDIEYLDEVPVATVPANPDVPDYVESYVQPGAISSSARFVLSGSTFVLSAGTYHFSSANSADEIFIEVVDSPQPSDGSPSSPAPASAEPALTAKPTASSVLVNGKAEAFDAYNINDSNYFKLRDLAYALSGAEKQFDVTWHADIDTIILSPGRAYTPVGGEMAAKGAGDKTPAATTSRVVVDGTGELGYYQIEIKLAAYNIGGNNYFKLRDIGEALDFEVDWDGTLQTIIIDTGKGYTQD
jgi:hypothetical protein